jgi:sugar-specific transcriptional regulator TrmB
MAEFEKSEFKFPDENDNFSIEIENDDVNIEIEDDTPEEDRNRQPMPKEIVDRLEKEELENYSSEVREKFKQAKKVYHDERREKEAALREREEALNATQRLLAENKRMKSMLDSGQQEYVDAVKNSTEMQLDNARRAYKEAYDSGDTDALLEAQELITKTTMQMERVNNFKLPPLQERETEVQPQQQVNRPDPRAMAWQERNSWFGQDEEMTAAALGLHEKLKRNGVVVGSDEYYSTLDKTMRKRFSENFDEPEVRQKSTTVVAPASRTTSSKKIRLKASQMNTIKKLGITPEQYVREVLKLEN